MKTIYAFDVETRLLAAQVAEKWKSTLRGASPWTRPDLFELACGVIQDVESGAVWRFGEDGGAPEEAFEMAANLARADLVVSYNGTAFDVEVLRGELENYALPARTDPIAAIQAKHLDLNVLVMSALDALPIDRHGAGRIRQGGLDGLARANGIGGKTGHATDVPALLRAGKVEEVLDYCAQDTRIVADLYRLARERGTLYVDGYLKKGSERIELGRLEVAGSVPDGDLAFGTCERCDDGMPFDELVSEGEETVCQPCADEADDRRAEKGS